MMCRICRVFDDFLRAGMVEYLDCNEENDALIAVYEKDITKWVTRYLPEFIGERGGGGSLLIVKIFIHSAVFSGTKKLYWGCLDFGVVFFFNRKPVRAQLRKMFIRE